MANVPRESLASARRVMPGVNGPTVIDILDGGTFVAVHAVVAQSAIYRTVADSEDAWRSGHSGDSNRAVDAVSELFRWSGRLEELTASAKTQLADRSTSADNVVRDTTAAIIERVRTEGDRALIALAAELNGVALRSLAVPTDCACKLFRISIRKCATHSSAPPQTSSPCTAPSCRAPPSSRSSPESSWAVAPIRSTPLASTRPVDARRIQAACSWAPFRHASPVFDA